MIYFGYSLDTADLDSDALETLEDTNMLHTCYSVSSYEPTEAIFGVEIDTKCCIFAPIRLTELKLEPTAKQKAAVEAAYAKLPEDVREQMRDKTPHVYVLESTDD
jgi:hypothetical protein